MKYLQAFYYDICFHYVYFGGVTFSKSDVKTPMCVASV